MEVYEPESPAAPRVYVPQSPKKATLDPNSRLGKLLRAIKNPLPPTTQPPFRPVQNWRCYVDSLRLHMKCDGIEKIISDHEKWEAENPIRNHTESKISFDVPDNVDHVKVHLTVGKSGNVKVRMNAPMADIYRDYFSKGVKPPTPIYIRALKDFGYPDEVLEKVLLKAQNAPKLKAEMEAVMERVFGSVGTSKPSKPKKSTINKRMKNLGK